MLAALALGFSRDLWSQAVVAEVYTLHALLTALVFYAALRWRETSAPRWMCALALGVGLGLANHFLMGLLAPALAFWVFGRGWRERWRPRWLPAAADMVPDVPHKADAQPNDDRPMQRLRDAEDLLPVGAKMPTTPGQRRAPDERTNKS